MRFPGTLQALLKVLEHSLYSVPLLYHMACISIPCLVMILSIPFCDTQLQLARLQKVQADCYNTKDNLPE